VVARICRAVDGLPLAIELAAARLRVFTPSELAFRLDRTAELLSSTTRDRPGRHRDIFAAIAWSYALLPDNDRTVFCRLSVFVGTWTLADAVAINPAMTEFDVVDAVESLLDKNLVRRADGAMGSAAEARFSCLFSIRRFAADRLDELGETDAARRRHLAHFADVATTWERKLGTADELTTFQATEHTRLDLMAALDFAREHGDTIAALKLAATLAWYWYTRGTLADVADVRDSLALAASDAAAVDVDVRAAALLASGVVAVGLGEHEAAERDLRRAVDLSRIARDARRVAIANAFLGHALRGRGDYPGASEHYEAARRLWVAAGSQRGVAWSAYDLGLLAYETGDLVTAEAYLREAVLAFRESDYPWALAESAGALGTALVALGQDDEAARLLGEALVLHDTVADRRGVAQCLESIAALALRRGDPAIAGRLLGAADAWRTAGAAPRSLPEQRRVATLDETIARALGRAVADAELVAGRTLPAPASIAHAAAFAAAATEPHDDASGVLTARQRDVAALVAAGHTNRQIGRLLGISEKTAEVHIRNIMERLSTPSRAGVAAWAAARGLAPPPT
jgi:non-specific serine/threonine protein kinase